MRAALVAIALLTAPLSIYAACPDVGNSAGYVRAGAGGTHTGADWTNPFTALPATLVRGCTYYLAGGSYAAYSPNTTASSTTLITIQAATLAAHGTSTGWLTSYATDTTGDGSNPATFSGGFAFTTGYWNINGAGAYTGIGCGNTDPSGFGAGGSGCNIVVNLGNPDAGLNVCPGGAFGLTICPTNITASYIAIMGAYGAGTNNNQNGIYGDSDGGTSSNGGGGNFTFSHLYIFKIFGADIFTERSTTISLDHSYVIGNASNSVGHAEAWADQLSSNITISYNAFVSIEGSGDIVELWRGAGTLCNLGTAGCTVNNFTIYGNVFWYDSGNHLSCQIGSCNTGIGDGTISCINGLVCTNWLIYQNTIVNIYGLQAGFCMNCADGESVPSTWTVKNNLWWNNSESGTFISLLAGCAACVLTEDYNTATGYISGNVNGFAGAHDVKVQATPASPFVGWNSSPANFAIAAENANYNTRAALGSPYDTDAAGNTFTTDRGAYQFAAAAGATTTASGVTVRGVSVN